MRRTHLALVALAVVCVLAACAVATGEGEEQKPDPLSVFESQKCAFCHSVRIEGEPTASADSTSAVGSKAEAAASDAPAEDDARSRRSDLSSVGATWTAESLRLFLVEREEVDGRGHITRFEGTEEEWDALSVWLLGMGAPDDSLDAPASVPASVDSAAHPPASEGSGESAIDDGLRDDGSGDDGSGGGGPGGAR